ncbi:ATP-dependent DNA helicase RecG [Chrysiogenes arsenatis]|uniref:ATP-dependent DNA helicase RecG n=1 Tax=Chrysiogenes arsenatis TaxID=309797 RepID=UPI000405C437|nr:ATP-dependent DNA helicase RecG [Chrysiogenes arsenatis]
MNPVSYLKKVGPRRATQLEKLGITSAHDLLWHIPRDYRQYATDLRAAHEGEHLLVSGTIINLEMPLKPPLRATLRTAQGDVGLVWFGAQRKYIQNTFAVDTTLCVEGEVRFFQGRPTIAHPHETSPSGGGIVPLYPLTEGITQRLLQEIFQANWPRLRSEIDEILPPALVAKYHLPSLAESFERIHFPKADDLEKLRNGTSRYHKRLIFQEFFLHLLGRHLAGAAQLHRPGIALARTTTAEAITFAHSTLGFTLTEGQHAAIDDILDDLAAPRPMNRLLQGDVGSGKTAVAILAAWAALRSGVQVAVMAPTEILAQQLWRHLSEALEPEYCVALLCGSLRKKTKETLQNSIAEGIVHVVVGTHALVQEGVAFQRLGLAIIDEQHRFGVEQRTTLMHHTPGINQLSMSATPIPRTLALTLYADMQLSTITTLPAGRQPIKTILIEGSSDKRMIELVRQQLASGAQGYVVTPLIDESEKIDLQNAVATHTHLSQMLPEFSVELLHGKMSAELKENIMQRFMRHETALLVSTTVIEVGVNNPNATVMVIYHPERFGLSQLHQLRGRVGRGAQASMCLLYAPQKLAEPARERIAVLLQSQDGFEIAQRDLELRGPGEMLGVRQSGVPAFRVAHLGRDRKALEFAHQEVRELMARDSGLTLTEHRGLHTYFTTGKLVERIH